MYEQHLLETEGNALSLLAAQLESYSAIFLSLPENTLTDDDTLLCELCALLDLMFFLRGKISNHFWSANSLRKAVEWLLVRRLARLALERIGWPLAMPEKPFMDLLWT